MKNTTPFILAAALFCIASCSESKKETAPATVQPATATFPQATAPVASSSLDSSQQSAPAQQPQQNAQAEVASGLNPPHGQPGHRCDIQVGAPLNSAPSSPAITSGAPASALPPAPVLPAAPPISTAKGLNPPHGQPGHDCALPVGAPLKN